MKYSLIIICIVMQLGCAATADRSSIVLPELTLEPLPVSLPTLIVVESRLIEPVLASSEIELKEAPFIQDYVMCGWTPYNDQDDIEHILNNAEVVFKLTGVYEEWVPINGDPKKYYVLKVE